MAKNIKENTTLNTNEKDFKLNTVENSYAGGPIEVTIGNLEPRVFKNPTDAIGYIEETYAKQGDGQYMCDFITDVVLKCNIEVSANIWAYLLSRWEGDTIHHISEDGDLDYNLGEMYYKK